MKSKLSGLFKLVDKRSVFFFLVVGATSAFSYFCSFALLYNLLRMNYKSAVSIAYLISILVHFFGNRMFTFRSHGDNLTRHMSRYTVMVLMNYVITIIIMHIVVGKYNLNPYVGIGLSIALTVGGGYLWAKFWVFTSPKSKYKE